MTSSTVSPAMTKRLQTRNSRSRVWVAACAFVASSHTHAMQVELATAVQGELRPTIKGSTNLPNGMKLLVRVTRKESAFQSETAVEVQSSGFEVGPLSQIGSDLNPGIYSLEIVSVNPSDQSETVQAVIGHKGEELQGPLTKRYGGAIRVRLLTVFQIGSAANPERDRARREQINLLQTRWWRKNWANICSGGERYWQQKGEAFDRLACMKTCISNPPNVSR